MSRIATPNPEDEDAVLKAASDVIESEQANVRIEIEFAKAIRVGAMLRNWRNMMIDSSGSMAGAAFPEEWVDEAAMDLFHTFFPPPSIAEERVGYYTEDEE